MVTSYIAYRHIPPANSLSIVYLRLPDISVSILKSSTARVSILFVSLFLLALVSTGCKKAQLRQQLKELMDSTIVLPEKITCIYNGEVYPMPDSLRSISKFIVYIDSTECTTCRISRLEMYRPLFNISDRLENYTVLILFPNVNLKGIPIERFLSDIAVEVPVYIDNENDFLRINPAVPINEPMMQAFLVNEENQPVLVGDPIRNDRIMQLFKKTMLSKVQKKANEISLANSKSPNLVGTRSLLLPKRKS